jgi:hypothetical protein
VSVVADGSVLCVFVGRGRDGEMRDEEMRDERSRDEKRQTREMK